MPLSNLELNKLITELGYPLEENGICFGLAAMGMQAILANDVECFNQHIGYLEYLRDCLESSRPRTFAQCIDKTINDRTRYIQEFNDYYKNKLSCLDDNEFKTKLKKNPEHKDVQAYYEELKTINENPTFQAIVDARAFLEGIALYFSPESFPEIFEEKFRPTRSEDIGLTFFRVLPTKLIHKIEQKDKKTGRTYFVEQEQVEKIGNFNGAYTLTDLTHYFQSMKDHKSCQPPVTLILSNVNHSITVCYDMGKNCWILIDANKLPAKELKTEGEIAEEVISSLSSASNGVAVFSSEAYCTKSQHSQAKKWFEDWTQAKTLRTIHEKNKQIELVDSDNCSWLYIAARYGDTTTVTALLKNGKANPNKKNGEGFTPFHVAVACGSLEMINTLLEYKADPNTLSDDGEAPICAATVFGRYDVAEVLLKYKADPNIARTVDGATPAHIAAENGNDKMMSLLVKHGADPMKPMKISVSALLTTADKEHKKNSVEGLFKNKQIKMDTSIEGFTALHAAVSFGHATVVDQIIKSRVDIHVQTKDNITPLELGLSMGYSDIIGKLLCRELDEIKVVGSEKQSAVEKLRTLLTVQRDHKLIEVVQKEFECFKQLNQYIDKLHSDQSDHDGLSSLCSEAYADYVKAKDLTGRSEVLTHLNESIYELGNKKHCMRK